MSAIDLRSQNHQLKIFLKPYTTEYKGFNKEIVGFDIETEGDKNNFVLAVLKGNDWSQTFYNKKDLIEFINKNRRLRKCIIIATNLGFDFLGSFNETKSWKVSERDGRIFSFKYYQYNDPKKPIKFLDTLNYFPASVATLGEILKIPKMNHPSCFAQVPKNAKEYEELRVYCENDANISRLFFERFIKVWCELNEVPLKPTIASLSLLFFRRKFLRGIYQISNTEIHDMIFKSYYGGRTEVFKRGLSKYITCYDFCSLYPSVMLKKFPDPNSVRVASSGSETLLRDFEGIMYIEGNLTPSYIPPLPLRINKRLIFPVGQIKGWYTHPELRHALNHGLHIKVYGKCVYYTRSIHPFKEFVTHNYNLRLEQKKLKDPLELMTKLIMNSLYGKFAFNYRKSSGLVPKNQLTPDQYLKKQNIQDYGDYVAYEDIRTKPTTYSIPIWSSYVAAYGRIKLHEVLSRKDLQANILYCDTDSVFLDKGIVLPSSNKLGELELEKGYPVPDGIFVRPKFYSAFKPKIKGVNIIKTREDFNKLLVNPRVVMTRFAKYRTAVKSKPEHKWGVLSPNQMLKVSKNLSLEDEKRVWKNKFNYKVQEDSLPISLPLRSKQ